MNRRSHVLAFVLAIPAFAGLASPIRADTPSQPDSSARAAISQLLDDAAKRGDIPGVVGLVVDRRGVLYEGASGWLNVGHNLPLSTDAIFNIASMTKPVTSVAIMMLIEQGKLSLDDPVSKYLAGFDNPQVITKFNDADGTYETRAARRTMTIRHLLTHTSGIGYGFSSPILARFLQDRQKQWWEMPFLQDEILLLHDPGEKWTYGTSTRVLGFIVEKITCVSLETYFREHIFSRLNMVDTSFAVAADKQSRVITAYSRIDLKFLEQPRGVIPSVPTPPFLGDAGLYSTAHDYGQFIRMLLNHGHLGSVKILSERSVSIMAQNQIGPVVVSQQPTANPDLTRPFPLGAGHDKFGFGFQLTAESADAVQYRGPGSLSWAGLYNTEFWIDPRRGIGGVLLMQYLPFYDENAIRTLRAFEAAVYRGLVRHLSNAPAR
jgi:methyl acetate hydrolase